jgi:hypothetical protein
MEESSMIRALTRNRSPGRDESQGPGADRPASSHGDHEGHESHFWRHFVEMLVAMLIGMFVGAAIFLTILGTTWDEALLRYPVQCLLVMAFSMTVPMVAWMRHRGHGWRSSAEMAAAMVVPVIPFICLALLHVVEGAPCGLYCALTVPAMLAVMLYRRSEYRMAM